MATKRELEIKLNQGTVNKTVTINDSDQSSGITLAKVNAFVTQYNNVYETDFDVADVVLVETTRTTLSLS